MCAAFGTFPFPWLHFICLYSPHIMSPPSNLHWFLPCILHLSNVPPSKLHLLFLFFLHLQFLPLFNLHFAFPFFLQLSCVPLSDLHFPIPFFLHRFSIFSRCKHPRTSASRQHKANQKAVSRVSAKLISVSGRFSPQHVWPCLGA